jgi:hypothetical protein
MRFSYLHTARISIDNSSEEQYSQRGKAKARYVSTGKNYIVASKKYIYGFRLQVDDTGIMDEEHTKNKISSG